MKPFALLLWIYLVPPVCAKIGVVSEFVGSTPCDAEPRGFLGIGAADACERITWQLALSADAQPSTFRLRVVYGMQARNEPGFEGGGATRELNGTWTTLKGTASDPAAIVYRLTADKPERSMQFGKIGDDLLHLLNQRRELMVGNGGWSYTLNRKGGVARRNSAAGFEPASGHHPGAAGVFDGRSPCQDLARQLAIRAGSDCMKLKWRLILYQDAATGAPAQYILEGSPYRDAPRKGKWVFARIKNDPKALVYQLDLGEPGGVLSLLKADDNILLFLNKDGGFLLGDIYFSYTLNRITEKPIHSGAGARH